MFYNLSIPPPLSVKSSCIQGDSGGPMTVEEPTTKQHYLVGVVSWGIRCAEVSKYLMTEILDPGHKGCQKNQAVDIFLRNFYNFQYISVILNGDLGFEVRKHHVKFRNHISTHTKEILIELEGT